MRRVLILINNSSIGGTERRIGRLFARMADTDRRTVFVINTGLWKRLMTAGVVTGREQRVWRLTEPCGRLAEGIGLHGAPAFWLRKLDYLLFALLLLARYGLASRRCFHLVLGSVYSALPLMLLRPGHRTVISFVSADLSLVVGASWALPVYQYALRRATVVDALSEAARADAIKRGIHAEKILVSPGSVLDVDRFRPALEKRPWVVFAGRLVEEKNPLLFLDAVPAILCAVPSAKVFLCGEGPLGSVVTQALARMGLQETVAAGFRADIAPILGHARVFVSLQRQDNYPSQSLLEAMACGAVPVATDVGFTWKLVDETTGIRVKAESGEIATAIIGLLQDSPRCDRLGRSARQRVIEQHSERSYRAYLDALYAKVRA